MKKVFAVTAALALLCLGGIAQATITIDTVPVGNPGNAADSTGYGTVGYNYNIGKYEVTAGQYTAFLNAVAATDTYELYNTSMANTTYNTYGCGIGRSGASGSYTYWVQSAFVNRPVNHVSWGDSARFANWLHNGQPTGAQGLSTTEDGAYYVNGAMGNENEALAAVTRKAGWTWAIPSEDEWYKAAYYKGGGGGYWDYPTSSDTAPGRDMDDASGNNANYYYGSPPYPIVSDKYTTVAGEFQNSDSPYGTFDQGGNVSEWNDSLAYGGSYKEHSVRGGNYYGAYDGGGDRLRSSGHVGYLSSNEGQLLGFRVAASSPVPEPSSLIALAGGFGMLLGLRRRRA